jgi:diadenylate cyclase
MYCFFLLFKGTRAVQMFFGVMLIMLVWFLSLFFDLRGLSWLIGGMGTLGIVAIVIVFQPEIRGMLTKIGQIANSVNITTVFFKPSGLEKITEKIVDAVLELQKKTHGALVVLEKRVGLKSYADSGESINADFSKKLLCSIFYPGTMLHDGAAILLKDKILAAGCVLPMPTGTAAAESSGGMRHRAAKALAAETDALVIVVSEETGYISIAYRESFRIRQSKTELQEEIKRHWKELYET